MPLLRIAPLALFGCLVSGCNQQGNGTDRHPSGSHQLAQTEECDFDAKWLTEGTEPDGTEIADTEEDCTFYQQSVRRFLWATGDKGGSPTFVGFPTIGELFGSKSAPLFPSRIGVLEAATVRVAKAPNDIAAGSNPRILGSGIRQAGDIQGIVADRNGNPIFYSIHVSPAFAQFTRDAGLTSAEAIQKAPETLRFPGGIQEFKAAWQVIEGEHVPANYIVIRNARVPRIFKTGGNLAIDTAHPRTVTLALIAFHVAFTVNNHPEMIWATFEHAPNGESDVAPSASANPSSTPASVRPNPNIQYALFVEGTDLQTANIPANAADFDEAAQKFTRGSPIYRAFPASKETEITGDEAIDALNRSMRAGAGTDVRAQYRLVGAVWLKHPGSSFGLDKPFRNLPGKSSDDPKATLSGEAALSSTAMESFTQSDQKNCFACHDTTKVSRDVDPFDQILPPKLLNVSHVMSRFLAETPAEQKK